MNRGVVIGMAVGALAWAYWKRERLAEWLVPGGEVTIGAIGQGLMEVANRVGEEVTKTLAGFGVANWGNLGRVPDEYRYNANVMAFMRVIREKESSQGPEAYYMIVGGKRFSSFVDHPRVFGVPKSTAAGAYQIVASTWDRVKAATPLITDFSPVNQERAALQLIGWRGGLNAAIEGRLRDAIRMCKNEWTSLPGGDEQLQTYEKAREVFLRYGGKLAAGY